MNGLLQLPIGIEDYRYVKQRCFYVDRTMLLSEILESPESSAFLYTRPRRFGKSLMISMLENFFDMDRSSAPLFEDTEIAKHPTYYEEMNSRPVIHLNLKGLTAKTEEDFLSLFKTRMSDLYRACLNEGDLAKLEDRQREYALDVIDEKLDANHLQASLTRLEGYLHSAKGKTVVVLVDEYDSPLLEAKDHGYYDFAQRFFRNFLGNALKGNESLYKAVLTGVNQIAHASIFSDLNNLIVNNVLGGKKEYFGFAEDEVRSLLSYYGYRGDFEAVKQWYGGYRFQQQIVYNPWSILNFIFNGFLFRPYWVNTGSYSVLKDLLLHVAQQDIESLYALLRGEIVVSEIRHSLSFQTEEDVVSLYSSLLFCGYLTYETTPIVGQYALKVPNQEVKESLNSEILTDLSKQTQFSRIYAIREALINDAPERFEKLFSDYLLSSFSAFDLSSEKAYQIILVTLSSIMFGEAIVKSEANVGDGRCDLSILDKNNRYCYIIELKYRKNRPTDDSIQSSAQAALNQALRNRYYEEAKMRGVPVIRVYGIAFSVKRLKMVSTTLSE